MTVSENQARVAIAVAAAVVAYLLAQPDVVLPPIAKVILGAVSVALAVVNPGSVAARVGGGSAPVDIDS